MKPFSNIMADRTHPPGPAVAARAWRVFYTRARSEKKCEERLQERSVEVLVPKRIVQSRWSDRTKRIEEPLFRNYVFANVNEKERLQVLRVPGIVRSVTFEGTPARLRADEVENLRLLMKAQERLSVVDLRPQVGSTVTLTDGPLQGLTGEVMEHRGRTSLLVRIDSIQQAIRVEIAAGWVTEVST